MRNGVSPEKIGAWEQLALAVLVLGAVSAAGSAIMAALPTSVHVLRLAIAYPVEVATLLFIVGGLIWRSMTRRIRRALGDDEADGRYAAAWVVGIGIFIVADCAGAKMMGGINPLQRLLVFSNVVRVILVVLGLAVIIAMRRDLRVVLAGGNRVTRVAESRIEYDQVATTDVPPADDAFWQAAAEAAALAGADLPLLQTTRSLERRWLLVPPSGDLAVIRARPSPEAVLTLFTTPPVATAPARPPAAPEYYGLLQASPGDAVRFQLVLPSRVTDFLAAARGAHRAGLYRSTDPTARTAVTAASEQPLPIAD